MVFYAIYAKPFCMQMGLDDLAGQVNNIINIVMLNPPPYAIPMNTMTLRTRLDSTWFTLSKHVIT